MLASVHTHESWEVARKARNMRANVEAVEVACAQFKKWPCVTSINNLRHWLDVAERDIKSGDAAVADT